MIGRSGFAPIVRLKPSLAVRGCQRLRFRKAPDLLTSRPWPPKSASGRQDSAIRSGLARFIRRRLRAPKCWAIMA